MNIFNKNKTKWIPLGNYCYAGTDYVVFTRKNLKNGILDFQVKKVQRFNFSTGILPYSLIDVKEQWNKIINEVE